MKAIKRKSPILGIMLCLDLASIKKAFISLIFLNFVFTRLSFRSLTLAPGKMSIIIFDPSIMCICIYIL